MQSCIEDHVTHQQLGQHQTHRIYVGVGTYWISSDQLRRHVRRCADDRALARELRSIELAPGQWLGDAEVEHSRVVFAAGHLGQEDVVGLDIAMQYSAFVRLSQGAQHLGGDVDDPLDREGTFLRHDLFERFALEQLADGVGDPVFGVAEVIEPDGMRMLQGGGDPRLSSEPGDILVG